jgi:hypothetical protein
MKVTPVFLLMAIVAFWPYASVHAQADAPRAERPVWPPPGSTLTVKTNRAGSLGSGTREATDEWLGEVEWEGKRAVVVGARGAVQFYWDKELHLRAHVRDGKPFQTYDPAEPLYDWPLFVGKSWSSETRINYLERNLTLEDKQVFTVDAFEEITVPAGTFKTFRIRLMSPNQRYVYWYEPKLGMVLKVDWERLAAHPFGVGAYQLEALSYSIKK